MSERYDDPPAAGRDRDRGCAFRMRQVPGLADFWRRRRGARRLQERHAADAVGLEGVGAGPHESPFSRREAGA